MVRLELISITLRLNKLPRSGFVQLVHRRHCRLFPNFRGIDDYVGYTALWTNPTSFHL
jgi:hypothetical protein